MTLADTPERWPVSDRREAMNGGRVITVRSETVRSPSGEEFVRDVVTHPGAVAIVAVDDQDRVVLVRQYRHPVGHLMYEAPAGLLDVAGEDPLAAAQRELYEEAHLRAREWWVLADVFSSPGMTNEVVRVYLARGLSDVDDVERHAGEAEEADMEVVRLPLRQVVDGVLAGRFHNALLCLGALAADSVLRGGGTDRLRGPSAPWPAGVPD